jgi:hypothetical protein
MPDRTRRDGPGYDDDFYAWTQYQAEVLRSMPCDDNRFDRDHVAEEIEAAGRQQLYEVYRLVRQIVANLLLLAHGPIGLRRYGWMGEIADGRYELEDRLSPSLCLLTQSELPRQYKTARKIAGLRLEEWNAPAAASALPDRSPYSLEEICLHDWYPEPPQAPQQEET